MASTATKIRWWMDSVRGLRAHVGLYKTMYRLFLEIPREKWTEATRKQLADQERMVGRCLLHVLLVYPAGSGRMFE
jgi:hypothetical protein